MKKYFTVLLLGCILQLVPTSLPAQGKQDPYPGCGTIIIETRQPGVAAFGSWSRFIESQGVRLDRTDPTLLQLNTLPIAIKKMNCEYFIESTITDNGNILINLKWRSLSPDSATGQPASFQKWTYGAEKKSIAFTLYNEIMRLVDNYGYTLIWYNR